MIRREKRPERQQIISEYLTGGDSFITLSEKYGVNARTIQSWVRSFKKRHPAPEVPSTADREQNINVLKKQLQQAELKNELLEEMLRLSEEHTGINFRKKFGSGQ
jgi:transposase-like protein